MTEVMQSIPARLKNVAVGGHVAGADQIIDDEQNKTQETINSEVNTALGNKANKSEMSVTPGTGANVDKTTIQLNSGTSATVLTQHQDISGKQDTINDLATIRSGAAAGATAQQPATTLSGYGITDAYTKSETYTKTEVNGLVDTPHQEYVTVNAYSALPATGSKDTIYRVSNYNGSTSQVDASVYSEYAWNGSQYIFLCVKSQIGEVFDISVYNNNAKYTDLAAALNGGANIPQSLQKGGMSVKFVQSSDNKYVQYRCVAQNFSTTESDWQGVDDEPTAGSDNLVKSGGVFNLQVKNGDEFISLMSDTIVDKYINSGGNAISDEDYYITPKIQVSQGDKIKWYLGETSSSYPCLVFFDSNNQRIDWMSPSSTQPYTVPANTSYLRASMRKDAKGLSFVTVNNVLKFSYPLVWDSLDALNKKDEETDKEINSSKTDLFFYDINKNILINKSYPATSFWNYTQNDEGWGAVPPIEVDGGETITVNCGFSRSSDERRYLLAFDKNYARVDYWEVSGYDERTITLPNDTKYLCMSVYLDNIENAYIKIGNTYLYRGSSLIKQNDGVFPLQNLLKFRVAAWNIGLMHEGVPPTGIEPEDYDTQLASLKEVITNLSADILILEEYSSKVDSEDTKDSYDTVFKQFYPFYKAVNQSIAIFSRYPLFIDDIETTSNGSPYMKGYINVNNIKVGIIACHISGSATPEQRAADSNTFISLMNTYKYSIITGDFNTGNLDTETEQDIQLQLSPYINNEYSLGNWGYWGRKATYMNGKALDNITAKRINILSYNVLNERSVSDHYPTFSDVALLP